MNRNFFSITICLALCATAALADETKLPVQKSESQTKSTMHVTMKAELKPCSSENNESAPPKAMSKEEAKKQFEERKKAHREMMYNELVLSPEQRVKADELDKKTQINAAPLMANLKAESKKLKEMKAKDAPILEVWKQEGVIKVAKSKLKKHFDESNKSFEAILTQEQKNKYDARKKEMDKFKKGPIHHGRKHKKTACHEKICPSKKDAARGKIPIETNP